MTRSRFLRRLVLPALALALTGCGGGDVPKKAFDPTGQDRLSEFAGMLKVAAQDKKKPPGSKAELDAVEPMIPLAVAQIRSGDIVYFWGTALGTGSAVIAYEKKAETEGGFVLLQDGTVKKMSADEFKAAPKAKK